MTPRRTLKEEYFSWLYSKIESNSHSYIVLCKELHRVPFRTFVHNDENRCEDGLALRDNFIMEKGLDEGHIEVSAFLRGACSVFEVLVALANRMDDLMYDLDDQESHASRWFRELLMNLKLAEFTDRMAQSDRFDEMSEQKIYRILETLMDRTYAPDGEGGLFPITGGTRRDMRRVEIWYQLMAYLEKNHQT